MLQTDVLAKSERLAELCLDELYELGTVHNRGVKQAGFAVLKSPRMPSVLVEAGFMSNRTELNSLKDSKWQRRFGEQMAKGLVEYCRTIDRAEKVAGK